MQGEPHVFISYARADGRVFAEQVNDQLIANEFTTWLDRRNLDPHQDFTAELERAIEHAAWVLVCITPDSKRDDSFVRREIQYAILKEKPIVSLRFAEVDVHISLVNFMWLDFFRDWDSAFQELLRVLRLFSGADGSAKAVDPCRSYLERLYGEIVDYLDQTIFSMISLRAAATDVLTRKPQRTLPAGFVGLSMKPSISDLSPDVPLDRVFQSFSEAFAYHGGRLLLLGEPGAGKTITLMSFARDAVAKRLADPSKPLPVIAPISRWEEEWTLEQWLEKIVPLDREIIKRVIGQGNALLLLDGLDELGSHSRSHKTTGPLDPRRRFLEILEEPTEKAHVVVTCRTKDYSEIGSRISLNGAVALKKLDDLQMTEYLSEHAYLLRAVQLDPALRDLLRTPLLLSLFAYAYATMGEGARELQNLNIGPSALREQIFRTYVARRYEHERMRENVPLRFTLSEMYEGFGHLAVRCLGSHASARNLITSEDLRWMFERDEAVLFLELGQRLHLLVSVEGGSFQFVHLLLLYHFAFPCAVARLGEVRVPPLIGNVPWARRAGRALLSAFVAANAVLWDMIPSRLYEGGIILFRGVCCLASLIGIALYVWGGILADSFIVKLGFVFMGLGCCLFIETVWASFIDSFVDTPRSEAAQALGYVNDDRAIMALEAALDYGKADVQINALEALAKIDPEKVRQRRQLLVRLMSVSLTWVAGRALTLSRRLGLRGEPPRE